MALIVCPECGQKVSDQAECCPNCGYPIRKYIESENKKLLEEEKKQAKQEKIDNRKKEIENKKINRKPMKKKTKIILASGLLILVAALVFVFIYFFKMPYDECYPNYISALDSFNTASSEYDELYQKAYQMNAELQEAIDDLNVLINNGKTPLEDEYKSDAINRVSIAKASQKALPEEISSIASTHDKFFNVFEVQNMQDEMVVLEKDTNTLLAKMDNYKLPQYTSTIFMMERSKKNLEDSYKQYEQLTNPSEKFVIERLTNLPGIILIEAVTEDNDPNGKLNKQGGYTAAVYFSHEYVKDSYTLSCGPSPVDMGTMGGGCVEVYATAEDARIRNEYLASFDGTLIASGSHKQLGTVVVRTSDTLTATLQEEIETNVINALKMLS